MGILLSHNLFVLIINHCFDCFNNIFCSRNSTATSNLQTCFNTLLPISDAFYHITQRPFLPFVNFNFYTLSFCLFTLYLFSLSCFIIFITNFFLDDGLYCAHSPYHVHRFHNSNNVHGCFPYGC